VRRRLTDGASPRHRPRRPLTSVLRPAVPPHAHWCIPLTLAFFCWLVPPLLVRHSSATHLPPHSACTPTSTSSTTWRPLPSSSQRHQAHMGVTRCVFFHPRPPSCLLTSHPSFANSYKRSCRPRFSHRSAFPAMHTPHHRPASPIGRRFTFRFRSLPRSINRGSPSQTNSFTECGAWRCEELSAYRQFFVVFSCVLPDLRWRSLLPPARMAYRVTMGSPTRGFGCPYAV
jgi:hypothetical protein